MCVWYLINFTVSVVSDYLIYTPFSYVFWNGLYLYTALCLSIIVVFLWSQWLFHFKVIFQVLGHVFGLLAFFLMMGSLSFYFDKYADGFEQFIDWKEHMNELLVWDAMRFYDQYIITVAIFYVIRYFESLQNKENEKSALTIKNKEMELSLLKSQINPHFLFNTLNSISTLIGTDKVRARKVITQLSDVFRYALDSHGGQLIRLLHELDFIDNYIRIQQVRFGDRLKYIKEIEPTCLSVSIPPMVLQPLVENSVKYGIGPKADGGTIKLIIKRITGGVYFEVNDDGLGVNAKKVLDGNSTGIGLKNSSRRLKSFYGKSAGLKIDAREDGYTVSFVLPIKEQDQLEELPKKELILN